MKRISVALIAGVLCVFCSCKMVMRRGCDGKCVCVAVVGAVDSGLAKRVCDFVKSDYGINVRVANLCCLQGKTLEDQAAKLRGLLDTRACCVLALAEEPDVIKAHGIVDNRHKSAIVNVSALKIDDAEKYARRIEKESIRAVGHLLGLETCINPRCAMSAYSNDAELDAKGRNLCPPCRDRAEKILAQKGVKHTP